MNQKWYVPWLYITPALLILGVFLVYPTLETIWVSFHDNFYRPSRTFVGLNNYVEVFQDEATLVAFRNNALWLVVMTSITVGMGLMLAVLLDRVRYEYLAKSIIFLPMAISFTAASIIWRFVYAYKPPGKTQIGLLNGTLDALKQFVSNPAVHQVMNTLLTVFGAVATTLLLVAIAKAVWESLGVWKVEQRLDGIAWTVVVGFGLLAVSYALRWGGAEAAGWILGAVGALSLVTLGLRDRALVAPFLASLVVALGALFLLHQLDFTPQAWLTRRPWINNFALIVTGVWVWTGFCMVLLSAAYKGIPAELLEAARIDGASEWQAFWNITIPFMKPTIAVVTTTIVIFVLKTFDIVYVMTHGNYDTEVLANRMIKTMYDFRDFEKASAIAVVLLVLIVPFIVVNIRRFRVQEATR